MVSKLTKCSLYLQYTFFVFRGHFDFENQTENHNEHVPERMRTKKLQPYCNMTNQSLLCCNRFCVCYVIVTYKKESLPVQTFAVHRNSSHSYLEVFQCVKYTLQKFRQKTTTTCKRVYSFFLKLLTSTFCCCRIIRDNFSSPGNLPESEELTTNSVTGCNQIQVANLFIAQMQLVELSMFN